LVSWAGLATFFRRSRRAEEVVEEALQRGLGAEYRAAIAAEMRQRLTESVRWREIVFPFPMHDPAVERIRDIHYGRAGGRNLALDIYRPREGTPPPGGRPVLVQVHGGAWIVGSKNEQGIPLMLRMASHGWLCVSVDYRLSPAATFPDHLIDVKRAIAWVRERAADYDADPNFVVITGGSAGGHLASLAALTANDPSFQPGFESVDTSLAGCVSFYGVYDFTNRNGVYRDEGLARMLERWVMKASLEEARERYEAASPLYRVNPDAPPFFVIHGDLDTLVPIAEARFFSAALSEVSRQVVVYAEIPFAQHAFEIFPSLRCALAIDGVERFLFYVFSSYAATEGIARLAGANGSAAEEPLPPVAAKEERRADAS
jgi:acetyl esterase/lipase